MGTVHRTQLRPPRVGSRLGQPRLQLSQGRAEPGLTKAAVFTQEEESGSAFCRGTVPAMSSGTCIGEVTSNSHVCFKSDKQSGWSRDSLHRALQRHHMQGFSILPNMPVPTSRWEPRANKSVGRWPLTISVTRA